MIDSVPDGRAPVDPGGEGDEARRFASDLRLKLMAEHLDADPGATEDLLDPVAAFEAVKVSATGCKPGTTEAGRAHGLPVDYARTSRKSYPAATGRGLSRCIGRSMTPTAGLSVTGSPIAPDTG